MRPIQRRLIVQALPVQSIDNRRFSRFRSGSPRWKNRKLFSPSLDDLSGFILVGGAEAGAFAGGFVHAIEFVSPNSSAS
jgi:hypothetical protein